ncbi:hypothetical protein FGO68_gene7953 [Halteria grandinella]|uniref:Uncharacterized protein n=1 Tax=Halteria grandinella TaxID=5974 RepID=A0A8J8NT41_HALGN|nr:hypothetical protein FGO68_gene7953 [Halteria grandinella]
MKRLIKHYSKQIGKDSRTPIDSRQRNQRINNLEILAPRKNPLIRPEYCFSRRYQHKLICCTRLVLP